MCSSQYQVFLIRNGNAIVQDFVVAQPSRGFVCATKASLATAKLWAQSYSTFPLATDGLPGGEFIVSDEHGTVVARFAGGREVQRVL